LDDLVNGKIKLTKDDIVLTYVTTNNWVQYLSNIKGLITQEGSPSSHPILLCREKKIPCVIGIHQAFDELIKNDNQTITLDGLNRIVYQGSVASRKANDSDLKKPFETVKIRQWPKIEDLLPPLLQNHSVIKFDEKYWRRTPTFPLSGFELELNIKRFEVVPSLLGKDGQVKVSAKAIDGYSCNEMVPFDEYVSLFEGFTLNDLMTFNRDHAKCMDEFSAITQNFRLDPEHWHRYIDTYSRLRAYIWLGSAFRAYAERKIDQLCTAIELPFFYFDECSQAIQAKMEEIDTLMHREIHLLAEHIQERNLPSDIKDLDQNLFAQIENLSKKYRFEQQISLDKPLDLRLVYKRVMLEVDAIRSGSTFETSKNTNPDQFLLPEYPELIEWLHQSTWNRILQSDAHHIEARAKAFVRPKLLELGQRLVQAKVLVQPEQIFSCSVEKIAEYMRSFQ
jgi:phosphohistidine swiveling domain-containing protein